MGPDITRIWITALSFQQASRFLIMDTDFVCFRLSLPRRLDRLIVVWNIPQGGYSPLHFQKIDCRKAKQLEFIRENCKHTPKVLQQLYHHG